MPTRNVHLTEHFDDFITMGIEGGRYSDASDAVRAGLRLLEQQEMEDRAKLEHLRAIAKDAFSSLDRGEGIGFASIEDLDAWIDETADNVSAEIAAERRYA